MPAILILKKQPLVLKKIIDAKKKPANKQALTDLIFLKEERGDLKN